MMRRTLALALLAALLVPAAAAQSAPLFLKAFAPNEMGPGSASALTFTVTNASATPATGLTFVDTLPSGVTIADPSGLSTTCGGNTRDGSDPVLTGGPSGTTVSLSGATVPGSGSCTVTVYVTSSTPGAHTNISGDLTSSAGNSGPAFADLTVNTARPGFAKSFAPAAISLGGRSTLTFTVDNTANGSGVVSLNFTDTFPAGVVVASPANAFTDCSSSSVTASPGSGSVTLQGFGNPAVAAGASCTVTVDVTSSTGGAHINLAELQTNVGSSGLAVAELAVLRSTLELTKSFLDDPVAPGGTVDLAFTLRNLSRNGAATDLAFTDDLTAMGAGFTITGVSSGTCGGTVTATAGGTDIELSGGTLASGASCTLTVEVAIAPSVTRGSYPNTTSGVSGTVGDNPAAGAAASDVLFVAPIPTFTKAFTDDPVGPGGTVTLEFTIGNTSPGAAATDLAFVDPFPFLPVPPQVFLGPPSFDVEWASPTPWTLPADGFCGAGSSLEFVDFGGVLQLRMTGGSLDPAGGLDDTCTFSIGLDIPAGVRGGTYLNTTEPISATIGGEATTGGRASDALVVVRSPTLSKVFPTSPFAPGATAPLEFTLRLAPEATTDATGIAFSDNLDDALTGLVATGLPLAACGGTLTTANGGATIDFAGGTLQPGEECSFTVSTTVPVGATPATYTNITTQPTATVAGLAVVSVAAETDFEVAALSLSKAFPDGPASPGGTATLAFTIANDGGDAASDIAFSDDLDQMLSGATATALLANTCGGTVSGTSGGSVVALSGGAVAAGGSCSFSVTVAIPAATLPNNYLNRTTSPTATVASSPTSFRLAQATLVVDSGVSLAFSKAFTPGLIAVDGTSVLTFTLDNTSNAAAATGLDFTDVFPSDVVVASPANTSTTCTGGTLTAAAGSGSVSYTVGSVGAGASCEVSVSVTSAVDGIYDNVSGDLTSSDGNSGTAEARLVVSPLDLRVEKTDVLNDLDADEAADEDETISYTVEVSYDNDRASSALTFADTPGVGTTLVPGSVTTDKGTVTSGNTAGDTAVGVDLGAFTGPGVAVISFNVAVGPRGAETEVCNQGVLTSSGGDVHTDDPDTALLADPTCTVAHPNEPPVANAGPDATRQCVGPTGAVVQLDGSGSTDPNDNALTYSWAGPFPEGSGTVTGVNPTVTLPTGVSVVTLTVEDPSGETSTDTVEITVEDTAGPVISVSASPRTLWPANHAYHEISLGDLGVTATDACDTNVSASDVVILRATSDEVENGPGDGNTLNDMVFLRTCDAVQLRAERQGNGDGRVYTVTLAVADGGGNVGTTDYLVSVPKNQNSVAVAGPPVYTVAGCDPAPAFDDSELDAMAGPSVEDRTALPDAFALSAIYPNPFARTTTVAFAVPESAAVRISVYDALGREVAVLVDRTVEAGDLQATFDASSLPSGTYLVRMTAATGFATTRPITVLR